MQLSGFTLQSESLSVNAKSKALRIMPGLQELFCRVEGNVGAALSFPTQLLCVFRLLL